jgi:hypothetical protein
LHPLTRQKIAITEQTIIDGDQGGTSSNFNQPGGDNASQMEYSDLIPPENHLRPSKPIESIVQNKKNLPVVRSKNINWMNGQKTVMATGGKVTHKSPQKNQDKVEDQDQGLNQKVSKHSTKASE